MQLIKFLEKRPESVNIATGNMMHASWYLYECPVCLKHVEGRGKRGLRFNSCWDCRGNQLVKHGMSNSAVYKVWQGMRARCTNPNNPKFHIYGGKGITVQESWETFEGFWKDNEKLYEKGLTIDRIDSSKGYNVDNVRWIPSAQNSSETTKRRAVKQMRIIRKPVKSTEFMQEWESAKKAADTLGLTAAHITAVCKGNAKRKSHGGFIWEYVT